MQAPAWRFRSALPGASWPAVPGADGCTVLALSVQLEQTQWLPGAALRALQFSQLDALARASLWHAGVDYDHGTGHGVGSYLSVHEGPQRISKVPNTVALLPGMIVSNEPGYYKTGAYGIRIENLVTVIEAPVEGGERPMLAFETLTLAPIDRNLVEPLLLTPAEIAWLDGYHARVRDVIGPLVDPDTAKWLGEATRPLAS